MEIVFQGHDLAIFDQAHHCRLTICILDLVHFSPQFGDLPKWDSMGHMDLMVALESQFDIVISAETISELVSVPLILDKIRAVQNG